MPSRAWIATFALASIVFVTAPVAAATRCVRLAEAGCDTVHATLQSAIDAAAGGDAVLLFDTEVIAAPPVPGCGDGAVCIRSHQGGLALLGRGGAIDVNRAGRYGVVIAAEDVEVAGLAIGGVDACCGQGAAIAVRAPRALVRDNVLVGGPVARAEQQYFGVLVQECSAGPAAAVIVADNDVSGWNWGGIAVGGAPGCAANVVVRGNRVHDNRTHGIAIDRAPGCRVEDNVVTGTLPNEVVGGLGAALAVYGAQAAGTVVDGNRVTGNAQGIVLGSTTEVGLAANRVTANGIGVLVRVESWLLDQEPVQSADVMVLDIARSDLEANVEAGVWNAADGVAGNGGTTVVTSLDASCNWWGDPRGPGGGDRRSRGDLAIGSMLSSPWLRHSIERGHVAPRCR